MTMLGPGPRTCASDRAVGHHERVSEAVHTRRNPGERHRPHQIDLPNTLHERSKHNERKTGEDSAPQVPREGTGVVHVASVATLAA